MTPKEKATELVEKFHYQVCNDNGISESDSTMFCAKQCALIAVEDIIKAVHIAQTEIEEYKQYWNEVKTEIQKL